MKERKRKGREARQRERKRKERDRDRERDPERDTGRERSAQTEKRRMADGGGRVRGAPAPFFWAAEPIAMPIARPSTTNRSAIR